jgi:hypothetical protein
MKRSTPMLRMASASLGVGLAGPDVAVAGEVHRRRLGQQALHLELELADAARVVHLVPEVIHTFEHGGTQATPCSVMTSFSSGKRWNAPDNSMCHSVRLA